MLSWGGDTNLYRVAANILGSDSAFLTAGLLRAASGANQVSIGAQGPAGQAGIRFGSAEDTNLYRSAAGYLRTDGSFRTGAELRAFSDVVVNENNVGRVYFGSALDTILYRDAANTLATGALKVNGKLFAIGGVQVADTNYEINAVGPGNMQFDSAGPYVFRVAGVEAMRIGAGAANLFATASPENLRVVRGSVESTGAILAGSDFNVVKIAAGTYELTFLSAFAGFFTIVAIPNTAGRGASGGYVSTTKATIKTFVSETYSDIDTRFHFIAIGPR